MKDRLDRLHARIDKAITHYPAGAAGGKGGQFAPGNSGGGGDGKIDAVDVSAANRAARHHASMAEKSVSALTNSLSNAKEPVPFKSLNDRLTAIAGRLSVSLPAGTTRDKAPAEFKETKSRLDTASQILRYETAMKNPASVKAQKQMAQALRGEIKYNADGDLVSTKG